MTVMKATVGALAGKIHSGGRIKQVREWMETCLRKMFVVARRFPYRIAHRSRIAAIDLSQYDMIQKGLYDYVPKGSHVYGPRSEFLMIRKNRYRLSLLPGQEKRTEYGVGWLTEDNAASSYDQLWGDGHLLSKFRSEGDGVRTKLIEEIVDVAAPLVSGAGRVVDVGCGVGDLLVALKRRCPSVIPYGCDFSEKAIAGAKACMSDGEFVQHTILDLPYPHRSFDVVLCTDTLEHLEQPRVVVAELVRVCAPGGAVVIVVPDGDVDDFCGHLWFWSEQSLGKFLAQWNATVGKLPQTKELLAIIRMAPESNGDQQSAR